MEESLRVQRLEELPSAKEFESLIEPRNVPSVFSGCIKNWGAFTKWNPFSGGLDYLEERVGSSVVEAMLSQSAPIFYGDLGSHERVSLPFSSFIGFCKQRMQSIDGSIHISSENGSHRVGGTGTKDCCVPLEDAPKQIYLAQVPIMNVDNEERVQLKILKEDIQMPEVLECKVLSSINLWMNSSRTRSSTHYDPHHNLLCIVSGCKQVVLWPPSVSPSLYPMAIYGEASNHSSVGLENPDLSINPRAKYVMEFSQKVILHAGDALFIPEGWFHQVDSEDLTIAINFWWKSKMMSCMSEHMDAYYLRRILRRLIDKEMDQLLYGTGTEKMKRHACEVPTSVKTDNGDNNYSHKREITDVKVKKLQQENILHKLDPAALSVLHELVSFVHNHVGVSSDNQLLQSTSRNDSATEVKYKYEKFITANFEDDPVAKIIFSVELFTFRNVLLAMAKNFPRTLEALVLHGLSPLGAEILTRKFDELDQQTTDEDRSAFYEVFYGAFDNQFVVMDTILKRKESFAHQAFRNVLDKYLEVNLESSKPGVR